MEQTEGARTPGRWLTFETLAALGVPWPRPRAGTEAFLPSQCSIPTTCRSSGERCNIGKGDWDQTDWRSAA